MTTHELKIHPIYFEAVKSGDKTFEFRKADRKFKRGDILKLQEHCPYEGKAGYTGRELTAKVTYLMSGGSFGLPKGYCIMAIKKVGD